MAIGESSKKTGRRYKVLVKDPDGVWYPTKTFRNKQDAREYERELLDLKYKGGRASLKSVRDRTVDDYWKEWAGLCRVKCSEGWKRSQDQMYRDYVFPVIGQKKLVEITKVDILSNLSNCTAAGLGPQMHLHVFNLLHKMFENAVDTFEYLDNNPVRMNMRPVVPKKVRNFLKPDDARAFLEFVKDEHVGPAIWIMTYLGLRIGEMQALQWWNIDIPGGTLSITQQYVYKEKRIGPVKNDKPIKLPMPYALTEYLMGKKPIGADPKDWVVPAETKDAMLDRRTFENALARLCKAHKTPMRLTPHELRHTTTGLWVESGATREDMRYILNHSSEASTKTYMHDTTERTTRISGIMKKPIHLRLVNKEEK